MKNRFEEKDDAGIPFIQDSANSIWKKDVEIFLYFEFLEFPHSVIFAAQVAGKTSIIGLVWVTGKVVCFIDFFQGRQTFTEFHIVTVINVIELKIITQSKRNVFVIKFHCAVQAVPFRLVNYVRVIVIIVVLLICIFIHSVT